MEEIISGSFLAIFLFLAITKASGFQTVVNAISMFFIQAVSALQGQPIPKAN